MKTDRNGLTAIGPNGVKLVSKPIVRDCQKKPEPDMCKGCQLKGHQDLCDAAPVCMSQFRADKKDFIYVLPEDL